MEYFESWRNCINAKTRKQEDLRKKTVNKFEPY